MCSVLTVGSLDSEAGHLVITSITIIFKLLLLQLNFNKVIYTEYISFLSLSMSHILLSLTRILRDTFSRRNERS